MQTALLRPGEDGKPGEGRDHGLVPGGRADGLPAAARARGFLAPWCGPCKQLGPALERAVADAGGKVALVKMNIDEHPQIAGQLGIQSIPAVIAFNKGQPVDGFVGALPESQIRGFIERLVGPLGGGFAELLAEAEQAAAKGDFSAGAAAIYAEVLAEDPGDAKAIGGLAKLSDRLGAARTGQGLARDRPTARSGQGRRSRGCCGFGGAGRGRAGGDRRRPGAAPAGRRGQSDDHKSRFDLAVALRPRATAKGRLTTCSRSSGGTASGTTRRRASSSCSCSKLGA